MGIKFNGKVNPEALANSWILVGRKKRTKDELSYYVGTDSKALLDRMKEEGYTFVTLFTMGRLAEYLYPDLEWTGRNEALFNGNLKALAKVGIKCQADVAATVGHLLEDVCEEDDAGTTMFDDPSFDAGEPYTATYKDGEGWLYNLGKVIEEAA